jgi:putative tricarboxylic transport membrane protein
MAESWRPQREVEIVAGTPPGGGLDRTARALLAAIESQRQLEVPAKVVNVPGDGARKAWGYMDEYAGDAHVLSISSPNLTTDYLTGVAKFNQDTYTPLAILYNEYIAFVARADSRFQCGSDLLRQFAADAGTVTVALSTAAGNPNHIAVAQVIRHAGGDARAPKIRVFDSALDAVADVIAGNADIGAITAASAVPELDAGRLRALAVSSPQRLAAPYAQTPTWIEQGIACDIGAWRGVSGAQGIAPAQIDYWENILAAACAADAWKSALTHHDWTPMLLTGARLRDHLVRETTQIAALLDELGLRRQA